MKHVSALALCVVCTLTACTLSPPPMAKAKNASIGLLDIESSLVVEHDQLVGPSAAFFDENTLQTLLFDEAFPDAVPVQHDLFTLSQEQLAHFLSYFNNPKYADIQEHIRFANYIEETISGFSYKGDTLTAREAFAQTSGNCLSLAILTTALIENTNLEFSYQKVDARPVYSKHDNLLLMSSHVRTKVQAPKLETKKGFRVFGLDYIAIDYFPSRGNVNSAKVSKADFIAMYYQNKAAEALIQKDYDYAYALIKEGLTYNIANPETLNLLAVLYKQKGLYPQTESVYETMMVHRLPSINTLENYAQLLMRENKVEQAEQVMAQVVNIDDNNPYRWIDLADTYLKNGKSKLALKYAKKANEMAPYLHEAYFIKSKAFAAMKKPGASVDAMRVAVDLSNTQTERVEYLNKLSALKQAYFAIEASTSSSVEN